MYIVYVDSYYNNSQHCLLRNLVSATMIFSNNILFALTKFPSRHCQLYKNDIFMWTLHKLFRPLYLWGRFSWHLKSGLSSTAWGHSYSAWNTCLNHHHSRNMCYTYEHLALSPSNWPEKKVSSCQGSQGSQSVKAVKLLKQWITSIVHIWTCLFRSIQPNAHPYICTIYAIYTVEIFIIMLWRRFP